MEHSLVEQTPTDEWSPVDYAQAAILGVYFAAIEAGGETPDLNVYDLDAPNENMYRIVAAFAWARKEGYFAGKVDQSEFRNKRGVGNVLQRPAHMKKAQTTASDDESTPQDDETTPPGDDADLTVLPISSRSTNLVSWSRVKGKDHDASPKPMQLYPIAGYDDYDSLVAEVSGFFKFQKLGQEVREIWFRWEERGMWFARPLDKEWSKALELNKEGIGLELRVHSRNLRRPDGAAAKPKTRIPLAINDSYSHNDNGLVEENKAEETIEHDVDQDYWAQFNQDFDTHDSIAADEPSGSDDELAQGRPPKRHLSHDSRQSNQGLQDKRHKSEEAHTSEAHDERDDAAESGDVGECITSPTVDPKSVKTPINEKYFGYSDVLDDGDDSLSIGADLGDSPSETPAGSTDVHGEANIREDQSISQDGTTFGYSNRVLSEADYARHADDASGTESVVSKTNVDHVNNAADEGADAPVSDEDEDETSERSSKQEQQTSADESEFSDSTAASHDTSREQSQNLASSRPEREKYAVERYCGADYPSDEPDATDSEDDADEDKHARQSAEDAYVQEQAQELLFRYQGIDEGTRKEQKEHGLKGLKKLLQQRRYKPEEYPEGFDPREAGKTDRQAWQKAMTQALQLDSDVPYEISVKTPTPEVLNRAAAVENMNLVGKAFTNEEDEHLFWKIFHNMDRASAGINSERVGPNITFSKQILQITDEFVPGMTRQVPSEPQLGAAAWMIALEGSDRHLVQNGGDQESLITPPTKGGILADMPGMGKTNAVIMVVQASSNAQLSGPYKPSLIVAPNKISLMQWKTALKLNAPKLDVFVFWGERGSEPDDASWAEAYLHKKTFGSGPDGVPEKLKFAFDEQDAQAKNVVVLTTADTLTHRIVPLLKREDVKEADEGVGPEDEAVRGKLTIEGNPFKGRFARGVIDEGHCIKDETSQICMVMKSFDFDYRWVITATPIINEKKDVIGPASFLYRPEWESMLGDGINEKLRIQDLSVEADNVILALKPARIKKALNDIDLQKRRLEQDKKKSGQSSSAIEASEFDDLKKVMPQILCPVQLKRANGTELPLGDGSGSKIMIGKDMPPFTTNTVDLCLEADAAGE